MSTSGKIKLVLSVLAILLLLVAARYFDLQMRVREVLEWVQGQGYWTPTFFVLTMVLVCMVFGPVWLVTMSAGIIFDLATS